MAAIGSGINPALGRIDYSPFLQGAQMAAQGRMQGASAFAEGVSQGFQDYLKKREQNAILEGKNNALLRDIAQDPQLSANPEIQKYTAKMAKGGGLTLNDNIKLNAELTTTVESARNRQQQQAQALAMEASRFQLDQAKANQQRADNDRRAYSNIFKQASALGRMPTQDELFKLGLYEGMTPEGLASVTNMAQNSAEFGLKMNLFTQQIEDLKNKNAESDARIKRIRGFTSSMPNGYRIVNDGSNQLFQQIDFVNGQLKTEVMEAGKVPGNIAELRERQEQTAKVFDEYVALLRSPDRDSDENINQRNKLVTRFNILNPKDDMNMNQTREGLDTLWGQQSPVTTAPGKDGAATPPPAPGKSNIKGVSTAAPGAQPTPAPEPAAAAAARSPLSISGNQAAAFGAALMPNLNRAAPFASMGFNLIEDARRRLGGGQAATTPAIDTSVGAPTPAAAPPVDLSAPASISAVTPFGPAGAERGEGGDIKLSKDERNVLQRAMSILDKTQPRGFDYAFAGAPTGSFLDYAYAGGPAGGRPEPEGRLMALRAVLLPNINRAVPFASAAANIFEGMSPRSMGSSRAFSAPPAEQARAASAAPQFLDKEARATAAAMQPEMETPLPFERYRLPEQGPIPQIKLSPAAQKIANELRNSNRERGKAPEFFLEASTGDNGKRTRVKLSQRDLDLFLSRTPDTRGEVRMGAEFQPFSRSYGQQLRQFRAR